MNKCEWRDGKFYPCDGFNPVFMRHTSGMLPYCYYCGTEYPRPKPSVIIKKSGGTWVARYDGVDYLCVKPEWYEEKGKCEHYFKEYTEHWSPISEIEITDELAKLRPMVIVEEQGLRAMVFSDKHRTIVLPINGSDHPVKFTKHVRLATVDDLA